MNQENSIEEQKKIKVALCVPLYGTVMAQWVINFYRFLNYSTRIFNVQVFMHEQQPVSVSRERMVEQVLATDCDYIFFMDSDMSLPNTTMERLVKDMENNGADLASALYFSKDQPHYAVIRDWRSGGFYHIENPPIGQVIPIAGCGMGAAMIHRSVFEKLEQPWFMFNHERWGKKDIVLSEDLYFCRKMIEAGMKQVCNTGVIADHLGGAVGIMEYHNFEPIRVSAMQEREELISDMMEFTSKSQEEVDLNMMVGMDLVKEAWHSANPQTYEHELEFYKTTETYLYDLALWHFTGRRRFDVELVTKIMGQAKKNVSLQARKPKVLDFGCGIGQNALMLARMGCEVTLADLDSKTLAFAEHRFKKHSIPYNVWKTDEELPPNETYDFILAFDVFEHMPESESEEYINHLNNMKHQNTMVFMTNSFGTQGGAHPMHYEKTENTDKIINKLLEQKK